MRYDCLSDSVAGEEMRVVFMHHYCDVISIIVKTSKKESVVKLKILRFEFLEKEIYEDKVSLDGKKDKKFSQVGVFTHV